MANKNEEIALKLRWKHVEIEFRWGYQDFYWKCPEGVWHRAVPDFEHDWAHAGPLLEELVEAYGHDVRIWKDVCGPERCKAQTPLGSSNPRTHAADTLTEAIAHAWLGWKNE